MSWLGELLERNSSDPRERLELGQQLLSQLQIARLPSDSTLLNDFCDVVVQWLSGSNYKVLFIIVINIHQNYSCSLKVQLSLLQYVLYLNIILGCTPCSRNYWYCNWSIWWCPITISYWSSYSTCWKTWRFKT